MKDKIRQPVFGKLRWANTSVPLALLAACALPAHAFQIDTGNPDLSLRWDNTLKYSNAFRVGSQDDELLSNINQDDSNRNFDRGLVSNRLDLLSELEVMYRGTFGARVSGAAWYDSVYNSSTDHDNPASWNFPSTRHGRFQSGVRDLHGRDAELLDYFVMGRFDLGGRNLTARLGQHSLLWGESLFYGANGIAGGMQPVDVVKAQSVPNTQFRELIRPVEQVSAQFDLSPDVTLAAYYQFEWEGVRLPGAGSYFSVGDIVGDGSERILLGPQPFAPSVPVAYNKPKDSGQGGVSVRFRLPNGNAEYGLYAIRYHAKTGLSQMRVGPGTPLPAPVGPEQFEWAYAENIKAFGVSVSNTFGPVNLGFEVSTRRDSPLLSSNISVLPGQIGDNDRNAAFAKGNTLHAQMSWIATLPTNAVFRESSFVGEVAWNRMLSVSENRDVLEPNGERDAWGFRMVFTPTYRQVLPQLDLSVPVGVGYSPRGRSLAVSNFGVDRGGDFNIGVRGTYQQDWGFGATYTNFFGRRGHFLTQQNQYSFDQPLADRDFISLYVTRTF